MQFSYHAENKLFYQYFRMSGSSIDAGPLQHLAEAGGGFSRAHKSIFAIYAAGKNYYDRMKTVAHIIS